MMSLPEAALSRRGLLLLGCAAAMAGLARADANGQPGVQNPRRRAPELSLTDQQGRRSGQGGGQNLLCHRSHCRGQVAHQLFPVPR